MVLGEAVSIDGSALVAILVVLLLVLLVAAGAVVLGFVWAWRAGRGSQESLVGWLIVSGLEAMAFFAAGFEVTNLALWISLAAIVGQAATFAVSRSRHPDTSTTNGLDEDGRP